MSHDIKHKFIADNFIQQVGMFIDTSITICVYKNWPNLERQTHNACDTILRAYRYIGVYYIIINITRVWSRINLAIFHKRQYGYLENIV